ncbi:RNA-directed DNA polymerase, eukaryota, reverse transcriptase zinc-binding domain protein [Tanacetum coccineum]
MIDKGQKEAEIEDVMDELNGIEEWGKLLFSFVETVQRKSKFFCSFIYAANHGSKRNELWRDLTYQKLIVNNNPWVMLGDFNVTLYAHKHSMGGSTINQDMQDFKDCVAINELDDLCSTGLQYTWTKSPKNPMCGILKKLDRVMCNEKFTEEFGQAIAIFLPYIISDHSPSMVIIPNGLRKKNKAFRFANYIVDRPEFMSSVAKDWKMNVMGFQMFKVFKKLKEWQAKFDSDPLNSEFRMEASVILNEYKEAVVDENKLLSQKAKVNWMKDGDKNIAFFHKVVKGRKKKSRMMVKMCLNNFIEDAKEMVEEITDVEIKKAMFDIDNDKAPGPDGFTSCFFKKVWSIVGKDVCSAMNTPNKVSDFRPIACCNVLYKCISKVLTNRIKSGLEKVVSNNQSAFIPGRHIQDNILLTQELLKGYNRKNGPKRQSYGYFKRARGLRQGDPISPYLFTLVMEVLNLIMIKNIQSDGKFRYHKGKDLKLTHLCFAGDLMVFCNGDVHSIAIVKKSLNEFSSYSGLLPNMEKSTIFFGSVMEPLIDCKQLVDKVKERIRDWKNRFLSYTGRTVVNEIDKVMKAFLWSHGGGNHGKAKIAWKVVCRPKDQGGFGIKPLREWNEVLLMKNLWKIIEQKQIIWVQWVNRVKLKGKSIWEVEGKNISVWFDKWNHNGPLSLFITIKDVHAARFHENDKIVDLIEDGRWQWPNEWDVWRDLRKPIPKRLQTRDIMAKWSNGLALTYALCGKESDSVPHLFFQCLIHLRQASCNWNDIIEMIQQLHCKNNIKSVLNKVGTAAVVYCIWIEINLRTFQNVKRDENAVIMMIKEEIKWKLVSLKVKRSTAVSKTQRNGIYV